jgi:uncharacterized protein (DUF1015 family)
MTEIRSFKAVLYNKDKAGNLSDVVCPPYDVISKQQQNFYYNVSKCNFIRVLLGKEKATDSATDNTYTRAKKKFNEWLKSGVLVEDEKPCIYYHKQEFKVLGQKHSRLGFISLMKIQDDKKSKIFPHENTHSKAKEDRLKLWNTLSSNLSPIFVCFSDKFKKVEKIFLREVVVQEPAIDIIDDDGVQHLMWRLENPKSIKEIIDTLSMQRLFIADGHHRYEVAKELRRIRRSKKGGKSSGKEPSDYVMTYFTDIESKDLQIFPIHRIIKTFPSDSDFLEEFFRVDKLKSINELRVLLAKAGRNEHAFGLYTKGSIKLLRLRNKLLIDKHVPKGSAPYKRLDATILKYFVFDRVGIPSEDIIYTKSINEAAEMVGNNEADAAFIMNPVKIKQLKDIALNGERMPPKTTYFYPKVLSGLTVYKMA